ncbi:hypothetical protein P175DRAFT_0499001 [Aspergillus ochraceoroseus IBT 24754]|uniref:GPI anchored protein n=2 Tax=Aspergillus ochraceoroseus TaxID=138278 RepID=A0A2T5M1Q5_9EURO|nr:uncharacterized protein P175DRAFT_0499001 [Aspergillus ochraceoroseus IBT 24754]KKK23083.1 hypothetical protein AOCH_005604 [Aspergillus ochraceoroseus]PTU22467.1 hypothetical protein P175DRAFT_0499001 [Aspergillus ochraceoroseus IBT 24754]
MLLSSLLLGVASCAAQVSADAADQILQHNAAIQTLLAQTPVQGVHKMSDDEGEKFFMDYWHFEDDPIVGNFTERQESNPPRETDRSALLPRSYPFHPSFALDSDRLRNLRFSHLVKKDFQCPSGTYSCTAINRPDSCCSTDETCMIVKDTGSGDVGCCPSGQTCSGTIGSCSQGYTSCPSSLGGGCCIPGYECVTGGCRSIPNPTR